MQRPSRPILAIAGSAGFLAISLMAAGCAREPEPPDFVVGANLPWRNYGHDFGRAWSHDGVGTPAARAQLDSDLFAIEGAHVVRWFLFGDGRALDRSDPELVWSDLDAALELADAHGVQVMPVLFDFYWFDSALDVDGVQVYGRRDLAVGPGRQALIETWIEPLADRYGRDRRIFAFDLINEPEWAIEEAYPFMGEPVAYAEMRAFVEAVADPLRGTRPLTLGSATWLDAVDFWADLELDYLQVHHYGAEPLPDALELGVEVPVLVGELASTGGDLRDRVQGYADLGYAGALPWSLNGQDEATDREAVIGLFAEGPLPTTPAAR